MFFFMLKFKTKQMPTCGAANVLFGRVGNRFDGFLKVNIRRRIVKRWTQRGGIR